jgi:DNA-binding LacI/PurR family transcriptional regulator
MAIKHRPTSKDVALAAGVNQSSVSRAFAGDLGVSEETRERIFRVAAQLNYTPNALARSLITQKTQIVGIVMAGITSPFQSILLEKFVAQLHNSGRQALVFDAARDEDVEEVLSQALQYQVESLIITSAPLWSQKIEDCSKQVPVLLFNRIMPGSSTQMLCCDEVAGASLAANLLVATQHRRFAYIAGNDNTSTNQNRERGFIERLQMLGHACVREPARYSYADGYAAMMRLLNLPNQPDGVFCASDIIAIGALDAARSMGKRVPDDIAVIGFDDIPMTGWDAYQLTTIRMPVDRMIAMALEIINNFNNDFIRDSRPAAKLHILSDVTLVERGSTRKKLETL